MLKALLPETGTDIKGQMRSRQELLEASGYANRPRDFDDLIHILDPELRLITPTDPEGMAGEGGMWRRKNDPAASSAAADHPSLGTRYYQLAHDYLVHSLRDWLTRKQRETRRGRAELRLAERAALWQAKPENRHLPSWWEYLTAVWLVPAKNRTAVQQTMLRKAGRVHAVRWGSALAVLLLIGFVIGNVIAAERQRSLRRQVATALDAVQNNRGTRGSVYLARSGAIAARDGRRRDEGAVRRCRSATKAGVGVCDGPLRRSRCPVSRLADPAFSARRSRQPCRSVRAVREQAATEAIHDSRKQPRRKGTGVSRPAWLSSRSTSKMTASPPTCAASTIGPIRSSARSSSTSCRHGTETSPNWRRIVSRDPTPRCGRAFASAVGGIPSGQLTDAERKAWKPVLTQWYETASDGVTHSAAGWALRQWGIEAPALPATSQPSEGRQWLVNSLGMTLLKINPGEFVRKDQTPEAKDQTVQLTRAFFLSDREISVGQFQQFISDANYPNGEKPEKWPGADAKISPTPDHPVQQVNWYDAVLFCNWLSRKEGRTPCYERTGKKEKLETIGTRKWSMTNGVWCRWNRLPPADGGGMGVRLSRRDDDRICQRRR